MNGSDYQAGVETVSAGGAPALHQGTDPILAERMAVWPVERLIPYARNPRTHSPAQVAQIAASIREFGFVNPVLIAADGTVIAGHGRLMVARQLGLVRVPVLILDHLTEAQRRAYVIADNRLALNAGWDEDLLAIELQELQQAGFDLGLTGIDERELDNLRAGLGVGADQEALDEAPPVPEQPVSRPGDL